MAMQRLAPAMVTFAKVDERTGRPGKRVTECLDGSLYLVRGYHCGDFFGRFLGTITSTVGEFEITAHHNPEMVGQKVEIPHMLAVITEPDACPRCGGTGEVCYSSSHYGRCPECSIGFNVDAGPAARNG